MIRFEKNRIKNLQFGLKAIANKFLFFTKIFNKRISLCLITFKSLRKQNNEHFLKAIDDYDNQ